MDPRRAPAPVAPGAASPGSALAGELEAALAEEMRRVHGAHTVILYGSRARGDATPESDVDVVTFADVSRTLRDARLWSGLYLDAFVHPTALAGETDADMLKLLGGRVLADERQLAGPLLERLTLLERQGPPPLPEDDRRMRRVWARKTLARIGRGDLEAWYRHHGLLHQLLEDTFALRGQWYPGAKLAFERLRSEAPETYRVFEHALAPPASVEALAALVAHLETLFADA